MNSVRVNMARLQNRMEAISAFGATAGGGVTRERQSEHQPCRDHCSAEGTECSSSWLHGCLLDEDHGAPRV